MENTKTEEKQVLKIKAIEEMSPTERAQNMIYEKLIDWIGNGCRQEFGNNLKDHARGQKWSENLKTRSIKLAEMKRSLGRVMYLFIQDGKAAKYHDLISDLLLSKSNPKSVVNVLGEDKQVCVRDQLIGTISVLTFVDLLKKAGNISSEDITFAEICTRGPVDVKDKVDAIVELGDGVTRLIQLKSAENDFGVVRIDPDNIKRDYFGGRIGEHDIRAMDRKRKSLEKMGKKVEIFAVLVPNLYSHSVNNVFGTIQNEKMISDFREEAVAERFIRSK